MDKIIKITKFQIRNIFRSFWLVLYSIGLVFSIFLITYFTNDSSKLVVSLFTIIFIINPLISVLFGCIYIYNSKEFIELVLTQPIDRISLFWGLFLGLILPFIFVTIFGLAIPLLLSGIVETTLVFNLVGMGVLIQIIFISISTVITSYIVDRSVGLGLAFLLWLTFCWIYDGVVLFVSFAFQDYPLEKLLLFLIILNPIDLARVSILTKLDTAAILGITGIVFKTFLDSHFGTIIFFVVILIWIFIPLFFAVKKFSNKDF